MQSFFLASQSQILKNVKPQKKKNQEEFVPEEKLGVKFCVDLFCGFTAKTQIGDLSIQKLCIGKSQIKKIAKVSFSLIISIFTFSRELREIHI